MKSVEYLYLMFLIFTKTFKLLSNQIISQAQFQFFWFEHHNIWACLQDDNCYDWNQQCFVRIECFELEEK